MAAVEALLAQHLPSALAAPPPAPGDAAAGAAAGVNPATGAPVGSPAPAATEGAASPRSGRRPPPLHRLNLHPSLVPSVSQASLHEPSLDLMSGVPLLSPTLPSAVETPPPPVGSPLFELT